MHKKQYKCDKILNMDINSSISFVSHIHAITVDFLQKELKAQGFDDFASSHGNILFQLSTNSQMTMGELARKINRDKSTTTVLVRKLKNQGYVDENSVGNDKRQKMIFLTQKGMQYQKVTEKISKELIQTFYNGFSEDEKKEFLHFLERIQQNFMQSS